MPWTVQYRPEVEDDLRSLGRDTARRALNVIEKRIKNGEPDKSGKALRGDLAGCRRIRTGDIRIVYEVFHGEVRILVIAVGPRRNSEIYSHAKKRVSGQ